MASKTTKPRAIPKASTASATPEAALSLSQDQLQALIGLSDVYFKGAEEMRRCQMEAAHEAREHYERAQGLVAEARTPAELISLQSELVRFSLESSGVYWQRLAAICAQTQADTMSFLNRSAATVGGDLAKLVAQPVLPAATRAAAEAAGATPTDGIDTTHQAWNQWVGLGKQWTDMVYRTEAALH
jgi:phasin family protein